MQPIFTIVEYKQANGAIEWKITHVDCTPMIDDGVTDEEAVHDWAFEKNCTEGWVLHNYNFFGSVKDAAAWAKGNGWYN